MYSVYLFILLICLLLHSINRNRAVDGDFVVVEILPEHQWQAKSTHIHRTDDG